MGECARVWVYVREILGQEEDQGGQVTSLNFLSKETFLYFCTRTFQELQGVAYLMAAALARNPRGRATDGSGHF